MARNNKQLEDITENLADDVFDQLINGLADLELHRDYSEVVESFRLIAMKLVIEYHDAIARVSGAPSALIELRRTLKEIERHALAI